MDRSRFNITQAIMNAYRLIWAERVFLLKTATIPFIAGIITTLFVMQARPDSSVIEDFLWNMPAQVLGAWFLFAQTRLIFFGQKLTPKDVEQGSLRDDLRIVVLIWLLFNMFFISMLSGMMFLAERLTPGEGSPLNIVGFVLIGIMIWAVRFGLFHIVAAVGADIKSFFFQINGVRTSMRLIGMTFLAAMPIVFAFQMTLSVFIGQQETISDLQRMALILMTAPVSFLILAVLNAAGCYAVKDILAQDKTRQKGSKSP